MDFTSRGNGIVYGKELGIFHVPPANSAVEKIQWVEYRPVSTVGDEGPVEFNIKSGGNQYIDLRRTKLRVKVKVMKGDGKSTDDLEHVGPINLFLHSLWSQVEVQLQQKNVGSSGMLYPFKAYLDTLLHYGVDERESHLQSQMYFPDSFDKMGTSDPIGGNNKGLAYRTNLVSGSRIVDMEGPLHSDVCQMSRYLLNGIQVSFKLWPSKNAFRLMSDVENADYKVVLVDSVLNVCHVSVFPEVIMAHNEVMQNTTAKYPFWRSELKHFSMSSGEYYFSEDNLFLGEVPTRMVICLLPSKAMSGDYKMNPFNFQHYNVDNITITVDNENIPGQPLTPKFGGENYINAFDNLFSDNDQYKGISRKAYGSGYTLFVFDLEPALDEKDYWPLLKRGNLKLNIHLGKAVTETVEVLIYATFPDLFEVDNARAILK